MRDPEESLPAPLAVQALARAGVAIWILDASTGVTCFGNARLASLLGAAPWIPAHVADLPLFTLDGDALGGDALPFTRVISTRAPTVVLAALDAARARIVRWEASPLLADDGAVAQVLLVGVDATAEVHAERDAHLSALRLRMALDHAPLILWATDERGIVTLSEGATLAGLGVAPGQLVGASVFDLYANDPLVLGHIHRALQGESFSHESKIGELILDTWTGPIRNAGGDIVGVFGVSTDITTRSALQAQVVRADRMHALGTLAASIAHEINNPLTYAMLSADTLHRIVTTTGSSRFATLPVEAALGSMVEPLARLRDGLERIRVVTADMRSVTRSDDEVVRLDVPTVIQQTLQLVSKELAQRAEVVVELQPVPLIHGSEARVGQVVLNLLVNALLSTPSDDRRHEVIVTTYAEPPYVVLAIEDTGPGIPEALRERVFEPFFTTRPVGVGTGLGLFVCRNIVRGYGGTVTIHSGQRGGARFEVRLPIATHRDAPASNASGASDASAPLSVARILVIDDDERVRVALASILEASGHVVLQASTGPQGLDLLVADAAIDLCFCDLMMNGMTGAEVFARAVAARPVLAARIVVMTGGAFSETTRAFVAAHADRCVTKPFDIVSETTRRIAARAR